MVPLRQSVPQNGAVRSASSSITKLRMGGPRSLRNARPFGVPVCAQQPEQDTKSNWRENLAQPVCKTGEKSLLRRTVLTAAAAAPVVLSPCLSAQALPDAATDLWEKFGGGPADLYYPEAFMGSWMVTSTLVSVEVPMGDEMLTDARAVKRSRAKINLPLSYEQRFIREANGKVISDRPYNVDSLTTATLGGVKMIDGIQWDPQNPNVMRINITTGSEKMESEIFSRVTKRFKEEPEAYRLSTSEVVEQVFPQGEGRPPKVKASRCLSKYKWRSEKEAKGGPIIVGTQIVTDLMTAFDSIDSGLIASVIEGNDRPAVVYTYRLAFQRPDNSSNSS